VIASVSGIVKALTLNSAVIEVGGVGLLVHLAPRVAAGLSVGTFTSLQTSLLVKEDSLTLFGFESSPARELFELLELVQKSPSRQLAFTRYPRSSQRFLVRIFRC
jgi:Holliday junction DNA helicase RuvA